MICECPRATDWRLWRETAPGQHSIRINDQWRVCFVWREGDAYDIEITGYR
jgi:toxin HigB-1